MREHLLPILFLVIIALGSILHWQRMDLKEYKKLYEKELQNVDAYRLSNSNLTENIRQYQMTIGDLRASKDSVDRKLVDLIDELKIKDKKIEYLQYQVKTVYKTDTIQIPDTIFVPKVHIDTLIGDKWYSLGLKLDYPSTIVVAPTFNSEQYVIIDAKKEYNNTPSKIFFIRWFQKKHEIVEVNVKEESPYITNKNQKFIKVLK